MPITPTYLTSIRTIIIPVTLSTQEVVNHAILTGVAAFEYPGQGPDWYYEEYNISLGNLHGVHLINTIGLQWTIHASLAAISLASPSNSGWAVDTSAFRDTDMMLYGNLASRGSTDTVLNRISYTVQLVGNLERLPTAP